MAESGLLASKVCLITGAGRGIGQGIAEAFARQGGKILLVARSEEQLKATAARCKELGAPHVAHYPVDLTDPKAVDTLCDTILAEHKRVDVLVNNAGSAGGSQSITEGNPDDWDRMITLNLLAPMRLTRHLTPPMVEARQGLIINIGSVAGLEPMPGAAPYAASKYGIRGWSGSCYQALRPHNIKVVLICPGFVDTPLVPVGDHLDRDKMIKVEDIAEACLLAVRCGPSAVPEEIVMRVVETPYRKK